MIGQLAFRHMMGGLHPFGGLGLLGGILFLVFTAIVVALVIWALTRNHGTQPQPAAVYSGPASAPVGSVPSVSDSARQIARERLARGEIDPQQYRAIVEALDT